MTDRSRVISRRMLLTAAIQMVALVATLTLALDMFAHKRVEAFGGVNYWGYKGPVVNLKQPNEVRIVIVGGTRAFGWGAPSSALVSEIRRLIMLTTDRPGGELRPVVVINLAQPGALADSYPATIEHFSYLQPDYICLYDDLGVRGAQPAADSGVFALTRYAPALPLVLREKGMVWQYEDVALGYARHQPSAASHQTSGSAFRRAAGSTLQWAGARLGAADRSLARTIGRNEDQLGDAPRLPHGEAMSAAIAAAQRHARGVVVAVSPAETAEQERNLTALTRQIDNQPGSAAWFRFVDLGAEPALYAEALRVDGWNYASAGIALAAGRIAPALVSLVGTTLP
jgi:hypothetical protein